MDVFDILDSLMILVELSCSIGPSHKIAGADNLVEVIHHLEGKFGREEGDSRPIIERVPCFISQRFKFGNESINFPWGKVEIYRVFPLRAVTGLGYCLWQCALVSS